ncbi:MAG: ATP-dependent helicase [Anaerolinea sp.]|nr:ATP-dependent helicase [Anaerolinea sp.]
MTFIPRPKQQEILAYTGGKMGVSAVPGSGKTETLSQLAAQIINRGALDSRQEVLIVTLVNSAVDSFYQRVSKLVKERGLLPHVGYRVRTLHGLAHDIVRERPALVGLADDFQIVDERAAEESLNEAAAAWLRSHPGGLDDYLSSDIEPGKQDWIRKDPLLELVKGTANAFTRQAKDLQLAPEALRERLADLAGDLPLAGMGAAIYADYQRALAYRGAVDFDDLIRLALQALESDEALLLRLRQRWPYILEDEAQDSSRLQERILRTLAGSAGNWVRVGDPNQAIFETFTTASPEHLRRFLREEGVAAQDLPNSGRSTLSIIDLANRLIDWTMQAHPEPAVRSALSLPHIEPTPPGDPQPNPPDDPAAIFLISSRYSPDGEVRALVESLARWLPNNPKATVAVLVPRNQRGFDLVDALRGRGLPVVDSLLRSSLSTRQAAGALAILLLYLADPTVATKLARVYEVWRRDQRDEEDKAAWVAVQKISKLLRRIEQVEDFVWPRAGRDWLAEAEIDEELRTHLEEFRALVQRWQGAVLLPIDQTLLTLAQDLFSEPGDLALAHKLAVSLQIEAERRPDWRLPELANELTSIARNERRFIGFSEEDSGFDPNKYAGQVVVATIHKAKGLEWDRVYLMSVNSYDFPSAQPYDQYIAEKWFLRESRQVQTGGPLNLPAEALEQLTILAEARDPADYVEGAASQQARLDYVRERLRLLYVGITRAKKELIITWNTGRPGPNQADLTQALPFAALQAYWERNE